MSGTLSTSARANARDAAAYSLGGAPPAYAVRPASAEEAAEVVRACAADRLALVPWGGGVALAGEAFAGRYDVALDAAGLDRVTVYDPDDFTVTAEGGITLATLDDVLSAGATRICVVSAILDAANVVAACREFRSRLPA